MCFIVAAEHEYRYVFSGKTFQFVQNPNPNDKFSNTRYCSPLAIWGKPTMEQKTRKCSIVESGKQIINEIMVALISQTTKSPKAKIEIIRTSL
jgi:hypothetical protein